MDYVLIYFEPVKNLLLVLTLVVLLENNHVL